MRGVTPAELDVLLSQEHVLEVILRHPTRGTIWTTRSLLYKLKLGYPSRYPAPLKRRAKGVLQQLSARGILVPKRGWHVANDGSLEPGFLLNPVWENEVHVPDAGEDLFQ
jgi:hypothetical protein